VTEILIQLGYLGMLIAAFLAGSFIPFSSEAVMSTLILTTDMDPWLTVLSATVGNVAGSMFNYWLGTHADPTRLAQRLRVTPRQMERATRLTNRYGAWMGLITFVPILGSAISIALGVMRASWWRVTITTTIGKSVRYVLIVLTLLAMV